MHTTWLHRMRDAPIKRRTATNPESSPDDLSLSIRAQVELQQRIVSGRLRGGAKLNEAEIARSLGISRGPVREAFRALDQIGLVRFEKNRGVFVREITLEEASDIYEVRAALEGLIGRLAARRIDAEQIRKLRDIVGQMRELNDTPDDAVHFNLIIQFHEILARMARNDALYANYTRIIDELGLFRRKVLSLDVTNIPLSTREHSDIVDAVAARDEELAARLLTDHALQSCRRLHLALSRCDASSGADHPVPREAATIHQRGLHS